MKFYGKAKDAASNIITAFSEGRVPKALAQVFLTVRQDKPSAKWSYSNRILMVFAGTNDARGFQQWKEVNRSVKKGAKAVYILGPSFKKHTGESTESTSSTSSTESTESTDSQALKLIGFHAIPVFRYEDTEGEPLSQPPDTQSHIDGLPLNEVAREWGLNIIATTAESYLGYYSRSNSTIALAVKNLSTWAHELTHAADDRLAPLKGGQHADQEIVAELGGATILQMLGYDVEADLGGAWDYIKRYAKDADHAISLAMSLIDRTAKAIDLILTTAESCSCSCSSS